MRLLSLRHLRRGASTWHVPRFVRVARVRLRVGGVRTLGRGILEAGVCAQVHATSVSRLSSRGVHHCRVRRAACEARSRALDKYRVLCVLGLLGQERRGQEGEKVGVDASQSGSTGE